jgi:5S rRNA maturation endonuclease (ribonuclease M5)
MKVKEESRGLEIPEDLKESYPQESIRYLIRYFNTADEACRLTDCFWSSKYQRLCFPYVGSKHLTQDKRILGCWMRSLKEDVKAKWLYAGDRNICWLLGDCQNNDKVVVVVEDVISAIKVSQVLPCICLGGTKINDRTRDVIDSNFKRVVLFLDGDEAGRTASQKLNRELVLLNDTRQIRTKKDPKDYDIDELKEILL